MTRTFLRSTISALAIVFGLSSGQVAAQTHEVGHWIGIWGLTPAQSLRVCISNSQHAREALLADSFWFVELTNSDSLNVLQKEVRVPAGGFECSEVPYAELVEAGLPADPATGAVTFRIEVLGQRGRIEETIGANQTRTIGAVMSVDAATGKIETYEGFPEIAGNFRDTAR